MRAKTVIGSVAALLVVVGVPAGASQAAAVPRIAITCGMLVTQDAYLYLETDLTCASGSGVTVAHPESEDPTPPPHVTVDLRRHTLQGAGQEFTIGVLTDSFSPTFVTVKNGRIANFDVGIAGFNDTRVRNLELVDNNRGFLCLSYCEADRTVFSGSSWIGLVINEGSFNLTRSTIIDNATGAYFGSSGTLNIKQSMIIDNGVGVEGYGAATVSRSSFVSNDIAILMETLCISLDKVIFEDNGQDLVGSPC